MLANTGRWFRQEEQLNFIKAMNNLFRFGEEKSIKSKASKKRELSKETILKRVTPQIMEMEEKKLEWKTPEQWDCSFYLLGKGSKYRTSKAILSRMDWKTFLNEAMSITLLKKKTNFDS